MKRDVSRGTPAPPASAAGVFHDHLAQAERYVGWLAGAGIQRGLLGPREVPRLWERHLLNCAALVGLVPWGSTVVDIGSGAGLPGLALALARPDLTVTLVEPLLRRTTFLNEVVDDLDLTTVEVVRGRAETLHQRRRFDVVTSRAVAPLGVLLEWSVPLTEPDGIVLALKGKSAVQEIADAAETVRRLRCAAPEIVVVEMGEVSSPVTVVRVEGAPSRR